MEMTILDRSPTAESLDDLMVRVQPKLRQVLYYYQIPPEDAEDLVQETFLTLLHKLQSVRQPEAWLLGTMRRRCLMYWRTRRNRLCEAVDEAILELVAKAEAPPQNDGDLARDLEKTMARLPPRCQSLLRLRYGLGYKPSEVADRLGYQRSSIRKITHRCLAALTRQLVLAGFLKRPPHGQTS